MPPTGRVNFTSASLKTLVRTAYRLENYQIIGGPDWLDMDRFDVQARPPENYQPPKSTLCFGADCPLTPVQLMMQGLLADRFQLKVHREMREMPVYELTIGKSGFKLKEVPEPAPREPGAPFSAASATTATRHSAADDSRGSSDCSAWRHDGFPIRLLGVRSGICSIALLLVANPRPFGNRQDRHQRSLRFQTCIQPRWTSEQRSGPSSSGRSPSTSSRERSRTIDFYRSSRGDGIEIGFCKGN
jgi:hypothetical protein